MKHIVAILAIIVILSFFILTAAYIFWLSNGKLIISQQIEILTRKKVSAGGFKIRPPFIFELNDIEIKDLGKIESLDISSGLLGFLTANIVLDSFKIVKPEITCERFAPRTAEPASGTAPAVVKAPPKKRQVFRPLAKRINIKDGKLVLIDHSAGKDGITITIKDIAFNLNTIYIFPRSLVAKFDFKGSIPWQTGCQQGKIRLEGWLDFFKQDMQASLKIEDIDGIYLYPYYSQYMDLEKARIEKAKLDFTSNIQGLKNNITADCHLELSDLVFKPSPPSEPQEKGEKLAAVVLDIFKDLNQGKIVLDFTIRTKMDNPVFGFSNIKTAVESKVTEHIQSRTPKMKTIIKLPITIPADAMVGTVKGLTDVSAAMIRGTVSVLRELKNAFLAPFRKEKAPEPAVVPAQQR